MNGCNKYKIHILRRISKCFRIWIQGMILSVLNCRILNLKKFIKISLLLILEQNLVRISISTDQMISEIICSPEISGSLQISVWSKLGQIGQNWVMKFIIWIITYDNIWKKNAEQIQIKAYLTLKLSWHPLPPVKHTALLSNFLNKILI